MKRIRSALNVLWNVLAGIILLAIVGAVVVQTPPFKRWLRDYLEERISSGINGTIRLGDIHGNFITGIVIDSVVVLHGDTEVIRTGTIEAEYNLLPLLNDVVSLSDLRISEPRVVFNRPAGGRWNIGMLLGSTDDSTTPSPLPVSIAVDRIAIERGSFSLTDSLSLTEADHLTVPGTLEYHRFRADGIDLAAGFSFDGGRLVLDLRHISGRMNETEFRLDTLQGRFMVTRDSASARNVFIRTANSSVRLDAEMKGIDLLGRIELEELRSNPTRLNLSARSVDFAELSWFLHPVMFLKGSAMAEIEADGQFGDLRIRKLDLATYRTKLSITGELRNLDRPSRLFIDASIAPSTIYPPDGARLMPQFGIPSFEGLRMTTLSGTYQGTPLNFGADIRMNGSFGRLTAEGRLNLEADQPGYEGTFTVSEFNFMPIVKDSAVSTRMFAHGVISGSGFDLDSIQSRLTLTIDSGSVRNLILNPSSIYLVASPDHIETVSSLASHGMKIDVNGTYDTRESESPEFAAEIRFESVDLARVLDDPKLSTDLTLHGNIAGTGTDPDNLSLSATLRLLPSVIFSHPFNEDEVRFRLDQSIPGQKELSLKSSVAEMEISGSFDIQSLGEPLVEQCLSVFHKVVDHTLPVDTAGSMPGVVPKAQDIRLRNDFSYALRVKDLQAISTLIEGTPFNAEGFIAGRVRGEGKEISMTGKGSFENFYIGNIRGGILLRNTNVDFDITNDAGTRQLERITANIGLNIGNVTSSALTIDSLNSTLYVDNERGAFTISGIADSLYSIGLRGVASVQPETYVFDVDSLGFSADGDAWRNREDVQLRLNRKGLRIMRAEMASGNESILIQGGITDSGSFDLRAVLDDVSISHFGQMTRDTVTFRPATGFQGTIDADIGISGSAGAPEISIQATGSDFTFRRAPVGELRASAAYRDRLGTFSLATQGDRNDTSVAMLVEGTIPVDLSFTAVERRFLPEPQQIRISASRFDIGMFQPLVPDLRDLQGLMACDIVIGGTPDQPEYSGNISIPEARFTFSANNITYEASGEMKPSGQKILLSNFLLKNVPPDNPRGALRVNGFISIRNYTIDDFDLRASGDLLFMSQASRRVLPLLYGTLFAATDTGGLRVRGTLDAPIVTGGLLVRYADLVLPPRGSTTNGGSYNSLQYSVIDDTTRTVASTRSLTSAFYSVIDSILLDNSKKSAVPQLRFMDRMRYDLTVETQGQTQIKMVVTPSTKEELFAELRGRVNILNPTGAHTVYGAISVVRPSYYNFLKQFDATGTLRFSGAWDNPGLEIRATYEGSRPQGAIDDASSGAELAPQKVLVVLDITGTRYEPNLSMSIKLISVTGDTTDRESQAVGESQSDAISFILTGKFRDDLNTQDRQGIYSNLEQTATSSVLAGVSSSLSTYLTDFVRQELPFIRRAEVLYGGGSFEEGTSVSLAGQIGYGTWRVAGRVFNKIGSANINYQMSLGELLEERFLRNLFLELERKVEGSDNTGDEKTTNSARVYYRISF